MPVIKTKEDFDKASQQLDALWPVQPGEPDWAKREVLIARIEAWEDEHVHIPLPDPVDAIKYRMECQKLQPQDLVVAIGTLERVQEILNGTVDLTDDEIYNLHVQFKIPLSSLISPRDEDGLPDSIHLPPFGDVADDILWLVAREALMVSSTDGPGGWRVDILCSDTFAYACADCEPIDLHDIALFRSVYERYGSGGLVAWCAVSRCRGPIMPVPQHYYTALHELQQYQINNANLHRPCKVSGAITAKATGFVVEVPAGWVAYCRELDISTFDSYSIDNALDKMELILEPCGKRKLRGVDDAHWWYITLEPTVKELEQSGALR